MLSINPPGAASDGRTGIPPVSCLTLTNGSPPINPSLPPCHLCLLFTLKRKGSHRVPTQYRLRVTPCGESSLPLPSANALLSSHLEFFSRFKIGAISLSLPLSLSVRLFSPANWYSHPCTGESIR